MITFLSAVVIAGWCCCSWSCVFFAVVWFRNHRAHKMNEVNKSVEEAISKNNNNNNQQRKTVANKQREENHHKLFG